MEQTGKPCTLQVSKLDYYSPVGVDEGLLGPPEAILDDAVGDLHAVDVLVVDGDDEGEWVADLDLLGHQAVDGLPAVDAHRGAGHGGGGRQRRGAEAAGMRRKIDSIQFMAVFVFPI